MNSSIKTQERTWSFVFRDDPTIQFTFQVRAKTASECYRKAQATLSPHELPPENELAFRRHPVQDAMRIVEQTVLKRGIESLEGDRTDTP